MADCRKQLAERSGQRLAQVAGLLVLLPCLGEQSLAVEEQPKIGAHRRQQTPVKRVDRLIAHQRFEQFGCDAIFVFGFFRLTLAAEHSPEIVVRRRRFEPPGRYIRLRAKEPATEHDGPSIRLGRAAQSADRVQQAADAQFGPHLQHLVIDRSVSIVCRSNSEQSLHQRGGADDTRFGWRQVGGPKEKDDRECCEKRASHLLNSRIPKPRHRPFLRMLPLILRSQRELRARITPSERSVEPCPFDRDCMLVGISALFWRD